MLEKRAVTPRQKRTFQTQQNKYPTKTSVSLENKGLQAIQSQNN